ncbi:hypothetical protein HHK36_031030 [Tetracentron sinense]|uniref:Uncharacterized protein n=1 Tax=Tetracentron sinense TaxID=13715 RepID=A0A835CYU1_TETSI|nr:hypothetical protein HHK36_031030 [Tetracentron sinense]
MGAPLKQEDLIPFTILKNSEESTCIFMDFDHVRNNLKLDDKVLRRMGSGPTYNINLSGDIKQMLQELET